MTEIVELGGFLMPLWQYTFGVTGLAASLVVNALVTGLIVFKILKVFLEVKATSTSVERNSESIGSTKLRHVIFIIIESGMMLFAIQLVRVGISCLYLFPAGMSQGTMIALNIVVIIYQMLNVIICSIHFYFFCFTDHILARASYQH